MQFAKSQIWGRAAKLCLNAVTAHAYSTQVGHLNENLVSSLVAFRESLTRSLPRIITAQWDSPMFLFTDASFSPDQPTWPCGLGGVLTDHAGVQIAALSASLTISDLEFLGYPRKSTVIFEAEVLAIVICLKLWRRFIKNRPCVVYVDNNSARDIAIAGNARTSPGDKLVAHLLRAEDSCNINAWYSRVPSESNIADGPSRDNLTEVRIPITPVPLVLLVVGKILHSLQQPDNVGG